MSPENLDKPYLPVAEYYPDDNVLEYSQQPDTQFSINQIDEHLSLLVSPLTSEVIGVRLSHWDTLFQVPRIDPEINVASLLEFVRRQNEHDFKFTAQERETLIQALLFLQANQRPPRP